MKNTLSSFKKRTFSLFYKKKNGKKLRKKQCRKKLSKYNNNNSNYILEILEWNFYNIYIYICMKRERGWKRAKGHVDNANKKEGGEIGYRRTITIKGSLVPLDIDLRVPNMVYVQQVENTCLARKVIK